VRGAIAETAEAVFYDQLDPEQREIARKIFLRLTELGGDASIADTRRRVGIDELALMPGNGEDVQEVIQALADARLITTDRDSAEVAHEALIREWPTLRGWLEEDRESLRLQRRLTEAAQEWDALGRDPELLYRGARLAQALEWSEAHSDDINLLEHDFLAASQGLQQKAIFEHEAQRQSELDAAKRLAETERARAEEQHRSSQKLRRRAVYLSVVLLALGIVAAAALLFWRQAMEANRLAGSRELAAAAVSQLLVDPERSALLAMHALETADTLEARNALHQTVPQLHLLMNIPAHEGGVPGTAWSPDGKQVATLGARGDVKLWDATTGKLLLTLDGGLEEAGSALAFSPDGTTLAAAWATQVTLWNLRTGEVVSTLAGKPLGAAVGYNLGVGQIDFSPDGKRLAFANLNGAPEVWDWAHQKKVLSLPGEGQPAKAIAFNSDAGLLATAGDDGIVRVWDAASGTQVQTLSLGGVIHSVAFSQEGSLLAAASEDGGIKVWDVATGTVVAHPPRQSGLYDIVFIPDGRIITAGQDGTVRVWDAASGEPLLTLAGPTSTVISVSGSPDGRSIASGAYDGSLRIWNADPDRELLTIPAHNGIVWQTVFSPNGKWIASAGADAHVKLWDAKTGSQLALPDIAQGDGFSSLAMSPDGSRLAAGSITGAILVWDSRSGEQLASLNGHVNMVVGLAFSPDGQRLASAAWDGTAKVWDLASEQTITTFQGHKPSALVTGIAFHPDGQTVITGADDHYIYQWEVATGVIVQTFSDDGKEIYGVAVSPDGSLLAAGDQDGSIILWNLASGERLRKFPAHAGLILRLGFNSDGLHLASAGFDRLAKIWDVKSGTELFSLYGNASNVFGVSFSPDGNTLATAGGDGTVRTYTLQLDALIELARTRLTRTLTQDECKKYLHLAACPK
jgi:WD40 repeat protein